MISARDISMEYSGKKILEGINLSIAPGEVVALIGPSGSGKSTLLRILSFLEIPTGGEVCLEDGLVSYSSALSRGDLGPPWPFVTSVFQQFFLWPHLTIRQNIELPRLRRDTKTLPELGSIIEEFEVEEFLDRYPNQISGGQKQRAALVRALGLGPRYLLLDEITSALDVEQASSIAKHLLLLKDRGIGILLVSHHLQFMKRIADRVVFISQGVVVEYGGTDILSSPSSEKLSNYMNAHYLLDGDD